MRYTGSCKHGTRAQFAIHNPKQTLSGCFLHRLCLSVLRTQTHILDMASRTEQLPSRALSLAFVNTAAVQGLPGAELQPKGCARAGYTFAGVLVSVCVV